MKSLKAYALKVLPLAALTGSVSAETITVPVVEVDMAAAFEPILDLIVAIGPLPFYLIGLVLGIVILTVILAAGGFVVKIFDRILSKI